MASTMLTSINYQAGGTYQQFYSRARFPGRVRLTQVAFASAPAVGTSGVASYDFVLASRHGRHVCVGAASGL
ncbi:MAG: hypothetical protein WKF84_18100 [Pyrinomonadaceae bacterium]